MLNPNRKLANNKCKALTQSPSAQSLKCSYTPSEFITCGSCEKRPKFNYLLSSWEDWGGRREQGICLRPNTQRKYKSANFQCLILKNLAYMPQDVLWRSLIHLSLVSCTLYFIPPWYFDSLAWRS